MADLRWAYSDESERANTMSMTVAMIAPARAGEIRSTMRGLLLPGQRRVHMAKEGARRQRAIVDVIGSLQGVEAVTARLRRPMQLDRVEARRHLIEHVLDLAIARGVGSWTLEDVPPSQRARDNDAISRVLRLNGAQDRLVYDHRRSHEEPMLWIPDVLGWAVGAGGDWRRRTRGAVEIQEVVP